MLVYGARSTTEDSHFVSDGSPDPPMEKGDLPKEKVYVRSKFSAFASHGLASKQLLISSYLIFKKHSERPFQRTASSSGIFLHSYPAACLRFVLLWKIWPISSKMAHFYYWSKFAGMFLPTRLQTVTVCPHTSVINCYSHTRAHPANFVKGSDPNVPKKLSPMVRGSNLPM